MKNYYDILEVSENASKEVIEKAYKVLVRKYHPDLQGNSAISERKIREINEAYSVLSDQFMKEQYDNELKMSRQKKNENNYQENDYGRMYKQQQRRNYEQSNVRNSRQRRYNAKEENKKKDASYDGIVSIIRDIVKNKPTIDFKERKKIDLFALLLTIVIVVGIGILLYFIPFTHDWMQSNFIDTPVTRWLFRK